MTTFCRSIADIDQWTRYVMAGDDVAAQGFYEAKNLEHTPGRGSSCWQEPAGYYTVSDTSPGTVGPLECLRPSGIITCAVRRQMI
ncbi:hypothetical protein [Methylorubrum sp. SB2]|uniref:hypothetical protein n=1 Tax=Methylorubrum subtropicum TaxID=3138812 RepID=UPI00313DACC6